MFAIQHTQQRELQMRTMRQPRQWPLILSAMAFLLIAIAAATNYEPTYESPPPPEKSPPPPYYHYKSPPPPKKSPPPPYYYD